jgi:hypothetical protein
MKFAETNASNPLSGQLKTWELSAGPRLEIPIWDPVRIAMVKHCNSEYTASHFLLRRILRLILTLLALGS